MNWLAWTAFGLFAIAVIGAVVDVWRLSHPEDDQWLDESDPRRTWRA